MALKWLFLAIVSPIPSRVLRRDDHLIPVPTLLHPFANEPLRVFGIIRVGRIDEITSEGEVGVEKGEWVFILAEQLAPRAADADAP